MCLLSGELQIMQPVDSRVKVTAREEGALEFTTPPPIMKGATAFTVGKDNMSCIPRQSFRAVITCASYACPKSC